jgi:hypothetical protein
MAFSSLRDLPSKEFVKGKIVVFLTQNARKEVIKSNPQG